MTFRSTYIYIIALLLFSLSIVFNVFPRSKYSALEKRELKTFPAFSWESLSSGKFTSEVSAWFSDSEPYRDRLMTLSMTIKKALAITIGDEEENVVFHASTDSQNDEIEAFNADDMADYENHVNADANAKIANAGIIIVGSGANVRALMAFGGSSKGGVAYAEAANKYHEAFGNSVNIYCMVIPTSTEFYCPEKARSATNPQLPTIKNIYNHLVPGVKAVDVYTPLSKHVDEDIYLRTDHHWAPLGGYYAAQKFAEVAGVPFKDLSHYTRKVVHGYVGTMYGYSKDIAVKNAPEDFVYHEPNGIAYTTTYTVYDINANYQVTGEHKPYNGKFFAHFKDGSPNAYCTFMGGDTKITVVRTATKNGRRLIILKDSFGNTLPGYLFFSFEEIHVIDSRYFTKNMKQYVADNHITDILFANNIYKAYSSSSCHNYQRFLNQQGNSFAPKTSSKPKPVTETPAATKIEPTPEAPTAPVNDTPEPAQPVVTPQPVTPEPTE